MRLIRCHNVLAQYEHNMCLQVEMLRCELRKSIRLVWLCVREVDVQNMVGLIHFSIEMLIYKIIWLA